MVMIVLLRLPVFIMGVAAGLLTLRGVEYPQSLGQSPASQETLEFFNFDIDL